MKKSAPYSFTAFVFSMVVLFAGIPTYGENLNSTEVASDSLYLLKTQWKNQEGASIDLKSFSGQPVIMAMTYTSCQYSCPLTLNKLKDIEKDLKKKGVQKYQFVVASFDPERDKPAVLKAYMTKRKLDFSHWTFLSAPSDSDARELAVLLNVNYQKVEGGDFSHSNGISLLDSSGRLVIQLKGLSSDHKELVEKAVSDAKAN